MELFRMISVFVDAVRHGTNPSDSYAFMSADSEQNAKNDDSFSTTFLRTRMRHANPLTIRTR